MNGSGLNLFEAEILAPSLAGALSPEEPGHIDVEIRPLVRFRDIAVRDRGATILRQAVFRRVGVCNQLPSKILYLHFEVLAVAQFLLRVLKGLRNLQPILKNGLPALDVVRSTLILPFCAS